MTANPFSAFIVGGQTAAPGGPPITVSGTTISVAPGGTAAIMNGATIPLTPTPGPQPQPAALPPVLTIGGTPVTANPSSAFIVGGQTAVPGGPPITVGGTIISVAPGGTAAVVNSAIIPLTPIPGPQPQPTALPPVLTINGIPVTANPSSAFVVGGQTAVPGGPPITVGGTTISVAPGGTAAVVNGVTTPLAAPTGVVVAGVTLTPGGPAVTGAGGRVYSLPTSATGVTVVNGATQSLPTPRATEVLVVGSQTLVPGGPGVTVSGTYVSVLSGGSAVIVGTQTRPLTASTGTVDLGGAIFSVFGAAGGSAGATATATAATTGPSIAIGQGSKVGARSWWSLGAFVVMMAMH